MSALLSKLLSNIMATLEVELKLGVSVCYTDTLYLDTGSGERMEKILSKSCGHNQETCTSRKFETLFWLH